MHEETNSSKEMHSGSKVSTTDFTVTKSSPFRRPTGEILSKKTIPCDTPKSERLQNLSPTTPSVKGKSEIDRRQITSCPLRRSLRSIKPHTLGSSKIKNPNKSSGSLDTVGKNDKNEMGVIQLRMGSRNFSKSKMLDSNNVQVEKKKMTARTYAQLFIRQKKRNEAADPVKQLKPQDELPQPDNATGISEAANDSQTTVSLDSRSNERLSDDIDLVVSDNDALIKREKNADDLDFDLPSIDASKDICILTAELSQHACERDTFSEKCVACFERQRLDINLPKEKLYCSCKERLEQEIFERSAPKVTADEFLNMPSLLENEQDISSRAQVGAVDCDEVNISKENLSQHITYECKSEPSRFAEYWVPVRISDVQLEQYCDILYANAMLLCTFTKNNLAPALREVLISVRKCCDHPYLVDSSLQALMIRDIPPVEYIDVGIKISGKLLLLHKMLLEIKNQDLKVLILYQAIGGYGKDSTGCYLDDFLHQKFGPGSYERVDACLLVPSKKQAALNRFNDESGRFVFLLENRVCNASIKLLSVDCIIIFDSDWSPPNDLRTLQRITINSKSEKLKVFRLYSTCTVEEKVLILAKQAAKIENKLQNINGNNSHMLLMWGALYLSSKCDEFHEGNGSPCFSSENLSLQQSLLKDVIQEFTTILLRDDENKDACKFSKILKVQQNGGGSYVGNGLLHGELEIQNLVQEVPLVFWTKLLAGRKPRLKYYSSSSRNRKRVQSIDKLVNIPGDESVEVVNKRMKVVSHSIGTEPGPDEGRVVVQGIPANHPFPPFPKPVTGALHANNIPSFHTCSDGISPKLDAYLHTSEEIRRKCDAQNDLILLKPGIFELCKILKLKEDAKGVVERLTDYILDNNHVDKESTNIFQAFQLSLCWITADLIKHTIDRKHSLAVAKQHLNFGCNLEEVECIYSMLLKKLCSDGSNNLSMSPLNPVLVTKDAVENSRQKKSIKSIFPMGHAPQIRMTEKENLETFKGVEEISRNCIDSLLQKQGEEVKELLRIYEEEMAQLENEYKVESSVLCSIPSNHLSRVDKLKNLEQTYQKKLKDVGIRLQNLKEKLMTVNNKEGTKARFLEVKSWPRFDSLGIVHWKESAHQDEPFQTNEEVTRDGLEYVASVHNHLSEEQSIHCEIPRFPEGGDAEYNRVHDGQSLVNSLSLQPVPVETGIEKLSTRCVKVDQGDVFTTGQIFKNRDELIAWTKNIGRKYNMNVVIVQSDNGWNGRPPRLSLRCARHGAHKQHAKKVNKWEDEENKDHPCMPTKKCECPFLLKGQKLPADDDWMLKVICGVHNHELNDYFEGRYARQLTTEEQALLALRLQSECSMTASSSGMQVDDSPENENHIGPQQVEAIQLHHMGARTYDNHEGPVPLPPVHYNPGAPVVDPAVQSDQEAPTVECAVLSQPSSCSESPPANPNPYTQFQIPLSRHAPPSHQSNQNAPIIETVNQFQLSASVDLSTSCQPLQLSSSRDFPLGLSQPDFLSINRVECPSRSEGQFYPENTQTPTTEVDILVEHLNQAPLPPVLNVSLDSTIETVDGTPLSRVTTMPVILEFSNCSIQTGSTPSALASCVPRPKYLDPLQNETERILKESEEATKFHEETKLHLKSSCEKETEDIVSQIRRKYEAMLEDNEAKFLLKKQELDANYKKVYMNKILAESFRTNLRESENEGLMSQLVQLSSRHRMNLPIFSTSTVPLSGVHHPIVASPQTLVSIPSSVGTPVGTSQNLTLPISSIHIVTSPTRPLHTSTITPSVGNAQIGSGVPSRAPHL